MLEQQPKSERSFVAQRDQPLIGVMVEHNDAHEVRYFTDEAEADQAVSQTQDIAPIKLAGVWSDLDGEEMLDRLDHIRHDNKPTPPLTSL